jgi:hypothetical protein
MLTRRKLCRGLLAAFAFAKIQRRAQAAPAPRLSVDRVVDASDLALPNPVVRTYRADVVVTLLGVPIFSRKNVGGALAAIREAADGPRKLVALRFAGGANPQRTHGFKYDGSLEEVVLENGSTVPQAAYFGFVSSSTNENYDQARQRILSNQESCDAFIAAEGLHLAGSAHSEKSYIALPDASQDVNELANQIRARFSDSERTSLELRTSGPAATTFLYSVRSAFRSQAPRGTANYVHNAKAYRLDWERSPDPHHTASTRFTGRINDLSTHQVSTFRVWLDDPSDLPFRIEFQPRSYLRISLEYDAAAANRGTEEA